MLHLYRKQKQRIFIGDDPLQVLEVTHDNFTCSFQGKQHIVTKGSMYQISPETIICYLRKQGAGIRLQLTSTLKILKEELYNV